MTTDVQRSLQPLFQRAEQENLWFYSRYQSLWFSPWALRRQQEHGSFRWGAVNWELRDPRERIKELREDAKQLLREADAMEQEVASPPRGEDPQ